MTRPEKIAWLKQIRSSRQRLSERAEELAAHKKYTVRAYDASREHAGSNNLHDLSDYMVRYEKLSGAYAAALERYIDVEERLFDVMTAAFDNGVEFDLLLLRYVYCKEITAISKEIGCSYRHTILRISQALDGLEI